MFLGNYYFAFPSGMDFLRWTILSQHQYLLHSLLSVMSPNQAPGKQQSILGRVKPFSDPRMDILI